MLQIKLDLTSYNVTLAYLNKTKLKSKQSKDQKYQEFIS